MYRKTGEFAVVFFKIGVQSPEHKSKHKAKSVSTDIHTLSIVSQTHYIVSKYCLYLYLFLF